ncbi:MAG TPA: hypothetical protein ENI97_05965 [Gammaproteobacteria bacterium]|nr:hypothetical protein [Gammaproteobacteria bacterium]
MKDRICTSCGYEGQPIKQCKASFLVDAFVWGTVGSFALATGLLPALVIPVAWTTYHLAKFNTTKCPQCGSLDMVSKDSRKGRAALERKAKPTQVWVNKEVSSH